MKKLMAIILIVIVCVIIAVFVIRSGGNRSISYEEIAIDDISLSENSLELNGSILASAKNYKHYKYVIIDENLYITMYGGLVTKANSNGEFNIVIDDVEMKKVNSIYLKNGETETKIYPN